jgi:hypothetical protein
MRTYIIPFFVHFLILPERFTALASPHMLENALHLCDFVSATEYTPAMLRVLHHLIAAVLRTECRAYESAPPTHLGSWTVVALQVAVRVAADNDAVLAGILARLLLETDELPRLTSKQMIAVYANTKDAAAFLSFVCTLKRVIGRGGQPRTLAAVLAAPAFLQRLVEAQAENEHVRDVVVWARAQTEKCRELRQQLTLNDVHAILADGQSRIAPAFEVRPRVGADRGVLEGGSRD